jgi:hypothetical protein
MADAFAVNQGNAGDAKTSFQWPPVSATVDTYFNSLKRPSGYFQVKQPKKASDS